MPTQEQIDAVTIGQLREHLRTRIAQETDTLSKLAQSPQNNPEHVVQKHLNDSILPLRKKLDELHTWAGAYLMVQQIPQAAATTTTTKAAYDKLDSRGP